MSWDHVWERIFRTRDWGRYPPEELIRFVAKHLYSAPDRKQVRILEIGCGAGANIWFLAREGFDVYGIDGSKTAILKAEQRLQEEGLKAHLQVGDIISLAELYSPNHFDAVVDVACLQHNRMGAVQAIVDQIVTVINGGGKVFSMMVVVGSWGHGLGKEIEPGTFADIREEPLQGAGLCHFFTLGEVQRLFKRFSDVQIEYSVRSLNKQRHYYKHWVIEGVKHR